MIPIKRSQEIAAMRKVCRIAANVLDSLCRKAEAGVNTYDLDQEGRRLLDAYGAQSACFNYKVGSLVFPAYTCLSVNDEIVHGIGSLRTILQEGDVLSVDVVVVCDGYIGDNARTIIIGEGSEEDRCLVTATSDSLEKAIAEARPGNRVGAISQAVEKFITPFGFGIVREFVGHGVGKSMHEPPQIPNFGSRKKGDRLRPGMTLAIEPMITAGSPKVRMGDDGWTALTADGSHAAHFEHTVLVTESEAEILTRPDPPGSEARID